VAARAGTALGAHDGGQALSALDLRPAGTADAAAVAAAQRQRVADIELEVHVRQDVIVFAAATDHGAFTGVLDVELVGRTPVDGGGHAYQRLRFDFGLLVAHADGDVERHRPVERGAVLQVCAAGFLGGADVLAVLGRGDVAGGACRVRFAADLGSAIDQPIEIEHQEAAGQARIAVAGECLEVTRHVIGVPDAVVVVGRRADAAPAVALRDGRSGAVVDLGRADAEIQGRII